MPESYNHLNHADQRSYIEHIFEDENLAIILRTSFKKEGIDFLPLLIFSAIRLYE